MRPIERFDPALMSGRLLEAEHLARYRWAAELVRGKRVLDAGCGTGYGSELLVREGASAVVGVDIDDGMIDAATAAASAATFMRVDLRNIPGQLRDFDAVVCFEVLEHIDRPEAVLDALVDVLQPDGVFIVSSPNANVYPPGNPYHVHEFRPDELANALRTRFIHVRLVRQHDWLATTVLEDDDFVRLESMQVPMAKAVGGEPGRELYSIGLASNAPLPEAPPFLMLTHTADLRWWQELVEGLRDEVEAKTRHVHDLEGWLKERDSELRAARAANAELHGVIRSMQATRLWRLGASYWRLRDRLLRRRLG